MLNPRLAWAILPYCGVCFGMLTLRSAWGALIGFHLGLLPLLLSQRKRTHPLLAPVSPRILLPVALTGLAAGLGLWLAWPLAGIPADYPARVAALGLRENTWPPFIAYFTLVNPWLEETYWRGILGSDSRWLQPVDFLFAGFHIVIMALFAAPAWTLLGFSILTGAGWLWRQAARRANSLLPAALFHLLADFSILVVLYLKAG
jgi:membrane protease YdiL (CAAX protease family)